MGWWLGLAPATLEFWVRFPNEQRWQPLGDGRWGRVVGREGAER
jgi:hypothetical protein